MKKLMSLVLALAMVMALAATSFAATEVYVAVDPDNVMEPNWYVYDTDDYDGIIEWDEKYDGNAVPYGETVYFMIGGTRTTLDPDDRYQGINHVFESDAVSRLKVKEEWEMGEDYIQSIDIVKRRLDTESDYENGNNPFAGGEYTGAARYAYFVAVRTKASTSTSMNSVSGTLTFNLNAPSSSNLEDIDDVAVSLDFDLQYPVAPDETITDELQVFVRNESYDEDEETEFTVLNDSDDVAVFTVDTQGQGKLLMSASTDYDASIAAAYPRADLNFLSFNGPVFNKTGILTIYAPEGSYLYQLVDGELVEPNYEYDDSDEAFLLRTRTLGSYVIADRELDIDDVNDAVEDDNDGNATVAPDNTVTPPANVATGAAA